MTDANETNQGPHGDVTEASMSDTIAAIDTASQAAEIARLELKEATLRNMLQSQEEGFRARFREKDSRIALLDSRIAQLKERYDEAREHDDRNDNKIVNLRKNVGRISNERNALASEVTEKAADKDKLHRHYGKEVIRMAKVTTDLISEIAQKNAFAKDIGEKYDYIVAAHDALLVRISDLETDRESLVNQRKELRLQGLEKDALIEALEEKVEKNKHTESWQNGRRTLRFKDGTRWVNIDDTGDVPEMFWPQSARDRIETTQSISDGHQSAVAALEEELKASNALNVLLGKSSTISAIECFPTGRRCMTLQDGTMWVELYETDPKSLGQGISAIIESTESSIFHELRKRGIKITTLEEENDTLKTRLVELEQSNKELNEKDETGDLSMKIEKIRATAVRAENMSRALLSVTTVIAGLNQSVKDRLDNLAKAAEK